MTTNQNGYCQARQEQEWISMNPILDLGEMGYATDVYGLKIGDGFTPWNDLPYVNQYNKQAKEDTELLPALEDMVVRSADILGIEPYIEIKPDRSIEVPAVLKNVAVQYDNKVETVTFRCPRYWDERDIFYDSDINIIYEHSNTSIPYDVYNVSTDARRIDPNDDQYFLFDWTFSNTLTKFNGTISFSVNLIQKERGGIDKWNWNSQICQNGLTILPGYEDPEAIDIEDVPEEDEQSLIDKIADEIIGNYYTKDEIDDKTAEKLNRYTNQFDGSKDLYTYGVVYTPKTTNPYGDTSPVLATPNPQAHTVALRDQNGRFTSKELSYPSGVIGTSANNYRNYPVTSGNMYDYNVQIQNQFSGISTTIDSVLSGINSTKDELTTYIDTQTNLCNEYTDTQIDGLAETLLNNLPLTTGIIKHQWVKQSGSYYEWDEQKNNHVVVGTADGTTKLAPGCIYLAQGEALKITDAAGNVVKDTNNSNINGAKALLLIVPSEPSYETDGYFWQIYCIKIGSSSTDFDSKMFRIIEADRKDKTLTTALMSTSITATYSSTVTGYHIWGVKV